MKLAVDNQKLRSVCDRENVVYLGLFGSQARGESRPKSDIDLLVEFNNTKSYFELARIQQELELMFKRRVDLVFKNNIKSSLKPYILKDLVTLYEKR